MKVLAIIFLAVGVAFGEIKGVSSCRPPKCIHWTTVSNIRLEGFVMDAVDYEGEVIKDIDISGMTVQRTYMKAGSVKDIHINGNSIYRTTFEARDGGRVENVTINGNSVTKTQFEGANVAGVRFNGNYLGKTTLNGQSSIVDVDLNGNNVENTKIGGDDTFYVRITANKISRCDISGYNVSSVWIRGRDIEKVYVNGTNVKDVHINATNSAYFAANKGRIKQVYITGSERLDNVQVDGRESNTQFVYINGIAVHRSRPASYLVRCIANYGQPEGTDSKAFSSCDAALCQSKCGEERWEHRSTLFSLNPDAATKGTCYDHTCCCLSY